MQSFNILTITQFKKQMQMKEHLAIQCIDTLYTRLTSERNEKYKILNVGRVSFCIVGSEKLEERVKLSLNRVIRPALVVEHRNFPPQNLIDCHPQASPIRACAVSSNSKDQN